jgi:hypothetical protein
MAIKIVDEQPGSGDVFLTANEHARLQAEYQKAFMFYAGVPPTFESWVRGKQGGSLLNENQLELQF